MGTFTVLIEIGDGERQRFVELAALADSGSTFSWIPRSVLLELGHQPRFRIPLRLADGRRMEVDATDGVPIRIGGKVREAICVFAEDGGQPLLGATTLENHLLAVDSVARRLVPVEALAMPLVRFSYHAHKQVLAIVGENQGRLPAEIASGCPLAMTVGGRGLILRRVRIAIVPLVMTLASCTPGSLTGPSPTTGPSVPSADPSQALHDAQAALERAGGYTLTVEQSNFVLPQWGGSDGGTVRVSGDGQTATAELARTGEGGPYSIVLSGGQTFFRRATCPTWARIPGGGPDVLRPFILAKTKALATTTNAKREGATIEVDSASGRPLRITSDTNGKPLRWEFSRWSEPVTASVPASGVVDCGPGGNSC